MFEAYKKWKRCSSMMQPLNVAMASICVAVGTAAPQEFPLAAAQIAPGSPATLSEGSGSELPLAAAATVGSTQWQLRDASKNELAGRAASRMGMPVRSDRIRRITLEQVKQQKFVNPAPNPLARLGQLSMEAAKQHRLGVQADYFPKLGATVANLHYSDFLGQVLTVKRPLVGSTLQVPVPLVSQNQTIAAVTLIQPITPLFKIYQAVQIARADEQIAKAKAGLSIAKNASEDDIEETYFRLLIAQCQMIFAELKLRSAEYQPLYASASNEFARGSGQEPELVEAKKTLVTTATNVKELTASLNRWMGWPNDTELELVPPDPLVENISLEEVSDKSTAVNPEVIEAEQTVLKARAAFVLAKLEYVPTVAAVGGYMFQNAIPLVPSNFGYGGVMVSYNLFDFGKRERAVKEASAQVGMAEAAVELTKAKIAANLKKAYCELKRTRQLSQLTQQMGAAVTQLMEVSLTPESIEVKAARAKVKTQMLEADLAHRQAYAGLKALMGPHQ